MHDEGLPGTQPYGRRLPHITSAPPGPRSLALAKRLSAVESRNVTYLAKDFPVFWERAEGANVTDVDGNVYVDLTAAFGVAAAGHGHPAVLSAIRAQATELVHGMGDIHPTEAKVRLLERLSSLAPWDDAKCVLASTGSEAVEIALKTAELRTGRSGLLAFQGAYHGLTLGALSATHRGLFRDPFEARIHAGVRFAPFATSPEDMAGALQSVERALADRDRPIGAVLMEPIQGRAGVRVPAPGFVEEVVTRARAAGAVVIFDEIFTGFGRTGRLFAHEWENVTPDVLCVGKALGGGMPISACIGSEASMAAWPASGGEAVHTSTFLGHPLSCAAAIGFLDALERDSLVDRARASGDALRSQLTDRLGRSSHVRSVRGRGMLIGIELSADGLARIGDAGGVMTSLLPSGYLALAAGAGGEVLELSPPFVLTREQADGAVDAIGRVLAGDA